MISADGTGNGDAPAGGFMRTIVDGAVEYERALIRAWTRAALQAQARAGRARRIRRGFTLAPDGVHVRKKRAGALPEKQKPNTVAA